jgi:curli biogenesis system outer membrane secretion channel CsgG
VVDSTNPPSEQIVHSNYIAAMACLVLALSFTASAQTPMGPDLGQPPPPPGELQPSLPGQTRPLQLPHQGNLPSAPTSSASQRSTNLPTATIREFRSSVSEISPRGATDMFIAALVKSRKFRVLERARLAEGAASEKALNQQGMTTGTVGQSQYTGATYMFEATISEASAGDRKSTFNFGLAGAVAGQGTVSDSIAIDVRVTDVESGVVAVRKELITQQKRLSGVGSVLANLLTKGRGGAAAEALMPSDEFTSDRKDSTDKALREAIEQAVKEIAGRFASE